MATFDNTTLSTTNGLLTYQTQIKNLLTDQTTTALAYIKGSVITSMAIKPTETIVTLYNVSGAQYNPQIYDMGNKTYGFKINADTKLIQIRFRGVLVAVYNCTQGHSTYIINIIRQAEDTCSTDDRVEYNVESQGTFSNKIALSKKILRNKLFISLRGRGQYDPVDYITNPSVLSTASDYLTIFYIYNDAAKSTQDLYYQKAQSYYSMFLQEYNTILSQLQVTTIGDQYNSVQGMTSQLLVPYLDNGGYGTKWQI